MTYRHKLIPHTSLMVLVLVLLLLATSGLADTPADDQQQVIPNVSVLDHNGDAVLFYDDLVKDNIVAVNFIFTRCGMICPMLGFRFGQLRKLLDDDSGNQVQLVSITTDPNYDTPARIKTWAQQFHQGIGWTQITGDKQTIDHLLKSLKAFSADKQDHSSLVLLINDQRNEWKWIDGESDPQLVQAALSEWQIPVENNAAVSP